MTGRSAGMVKTGRRIARVPLAEIFRVGVSHAQPAAARFPALRFTQGVARLAPVGIRFRHDGDARRRRRRLPARTAPARGSPSAPIPGHVIQYVIVWIAQPARTKLQGDVAIAEVIGGARQQQGIVGAGGGNGFRAARTSTTRPLVARRRSPWRSTVPRGQEQPGILAVIEPYSQPALLPLFERQGQRVGHRPVRAGVR